MIEILGGGVVGSVLGGAFRLVPEFIKAFDRKSERQHELAMFDRQCKLEEQRGQQKLAEIGAARDAAIDTGVVDAFKAAIEQQTEMTRAAGGWVAALSASVRPVITYWVLVIWSFVHVWYAYSAWAAGASPQTVFTTMMSADFAALVAGTLNYWFLDRTLSRRGL
jgi:uncharacterized membrane protein (DUF106 family)